MPSIAEFPAARSLARISSGPAAFHDFFASVHEKVVYDYQLGLNSVPVTVFQGSFAFLAFLNWLSQYLDSASRITLVTLLLVLLYSSETAEVLLMSSHFLE